ncbi:GNAT family N-acetyltransferase [Streptomyces sp. HF10]|uniref:GNAT family N-acetyltransferase n=1 Tax=Streptomyces sp. HF10 TaxID=2692233 RepID=UPI0013186F3F|nr:GNAT family N-acetyltransferase [Streptomyces sp. HF10]QHC33925.1 GNAT family N-acetyltransferase [Streptomyces sp. HF10]
MIIVRAQPADLPRLLRFRKDAASWLQPQGIDQWSQPFPASNIAASIEAGEVFLFKEDQALDAVATVTLDRTIDPELLDLWTPEEQAERALYVHKLVVDRQHAGRDLGGRILDWAGDLAARQGERWLRLDAWTTNTRLHRYYLDHGFHHVRTTQDPNEVSGWLAQRLARRTPHSFGDLTGVSPVGANKPERKIGP